jgi:hypothetical protein
LRSGVNPRSFKANDTFFGAFHLHFRILESKSSHFSSISPAFSPISKQIAITHFIVRLQLVSVDESLKHKKIIMLSKQSPANIIAVVCILLLLPFTFTNNLIFHSRCSRSSTSLHRTVATMNNLDLDPFTSMLRREYQMKKEKARKRTRERMAAARANRSQEQIDADRDKGRESKAAARGNRSQEQIDADNETNKKRIKAARANRSQEQIDADRDKGRESKAAARGNRSQEQI